MRSFKFAFFYERRFNSFTETIYAARMKSGSSCSTFILTCLSPLSSPSPSSLLLASILTLQTVFGGISAPSGGGLIYKSVKLPSDANFIKGASSPKA